MVMHLALFEPDIPQNAGSLVRLGACMGVPVDIIEPCGFLMDDARLKRAGMATWSSPRSYDTFRGTCSYARRPGA